MHRISHRNTVGNKQFYSTQQESHCHADCHVNNTRVKSRFFPLEELCALVDEAMLYTDSLCCLADPNHSSVYYLKLPIGLEQVYDSADTNRKPFTLTFTPAGNSSKLNAFGLWVETGAPGRGGEGGPTQTQGENKT